MQNFQKYLPSKKFRTIVLFLVTLIIVFFTIKNVISFFHNRNVNKEAPIQVTVGQIIQKDSNNNGIADWEEYLWGLNPAKNGKENKEFILSKKASLEKNGLISTNSDSSITENEMLSRQFFATIISLQQTGDIDEETINTLAESIGQEIKPIPIPDVYDKNMLNIKGDSEGADIEYFLSFNSLLDKYKERDIGGELTVVSQGIVNRDPQALFAALTIASAYREFSKELIKLPVPSSAALTHLSLANNYEKTAQSIEGLAKVLSDPIIGMRSILNYKKYTDALALDLEKLSDILQ